MFKLELPPNLTDMYLTWRADATGLIQRVNRTRRVIGDIDPVRWS